jgi:peptide/nickel transport system permease protein
VAKSYDQATLERARAEAAEEGRARRRFVTKRLAHSPTFLAGAGIVVFWVLMAIFSRYVTRYGPTDVDVLHTLAAPSGAHWFGTDDLGRDVLSRTLAGAGPVFVVAPLATGLALLMGSTIGLFAGYYRGFVDEGIMRLVDVLLSLPVVVTSIVVITFLGKSPVVIILDIAILFTPLVARTVRATVIAEREREYVQAARLRGERSWYVLTREILPNVLPPIIVEGSVRLGYAVFTAATLSFLGFGLQPPSPDWGLTIASERGFLQIAWWTVLIPAFALATLVVGANLAADGLRKALNE